MSSDLQWLITRNCSSFLVKRCGVSFSKDPMNLTNKNSFKYSGVANSQAVGIAPAADKRGAVVSLKRSKVSAAKPAKAVATFTVRRDAGRAGESLKKLVACYRPDLQQAAAARVSAIIRSQSKKRQYVPVQKKTRGAKRA